jgi:hypothetical protein
MSLKWVAVVGLTLFAVFAGVLVWVAVYVSDQSGRCAKIGATYDGPGICKITEERRVQTP